MVYSKYDLIMEVLKDNDLDYNATLYAIGEDIFETLFKANCNKETTLELHNFREINGQICFSLPIDCYYVFKVSPRVAYKVENNMIKVKDTDSLYVTFYSDKQGFLKFKEEFKRQFEEKMLDKV